MDKKILEIRSILNEDNNFNINQKIKNLKNEYKIYLKDFNYVDDKKKILTFKDKYIRYVGFNNKINYGGIFYKGVEEKGKFFIYLINKNKKPWKIDFDQYYIFYSERIRSENESKRKIFDIFIKNYESNN